MTTATASPPPALVFEERLEPSTVADLDSPALVLFEEALESNLATLIRLAGSAARLRPHVKTHKMPNLVRRCEALGIHRHKVATIAEAEMVAQVGGRDVLIAYPLVGPKLDRLMKLRAAYPETTFRVTLDHLRGLTDLEETVARHGGPHASPVPVLIDLNVGMNRTGIMPDDRAIELALKVADSPYLSFDGLHAYDGHIRDENPDERLHSAEIMVHRPWSLLRDRLIERGVAVPRIVLGGTPAFPAHATLAADEPTAEFSPGTCLLHDAGYATAFPDLPFRIAAALLTRVISRPAPDLLCLDLGHKAVAADPKGPRVFFPDWPDAQAVVHSEEHLVIRSNLAADTPVGTAVLAIPYHICPTCALHRFAVVARQGKIVDRWEVTARDRVLTI